MVIKLIIKKKKKKKMGQMRQLQKYHGWGEVRLLSDESYLGN
jgi:hypothetical protein